MCSRSKFEYQSDICYSKKKIKSLSNNAGSQAPDIMMLSFTSKKCIPTYIFTKWTSSSHFVSFQASHSNLFFFAKYKYFLIFVAFIIHPHSQRNMIMTTINWRSARVCGFNKSDIIISYYFTLWKYQKCYCHSVKIWGKNNQQWRQIMYFERPRDIEPAVGWWKNGVGLMQIFSVGPTKDDIGKYC